MSNIIDYAQGLNAYSFDKVFFKDLDVLALTEVAYLPFDQIITEGEITLEKLAQYYTTLNGEKGEILSVITTPRIDLKLLILLIKSIQILSVNFQLSPIVLKTKNIWSFFEGQTKI